MASGPRAALPRKPTRMVQFVNCDHVFAHLDSGFLTALPQLLESQAGIGTLLQEASHRQ